MFSERKYTYKYACSKFKVSKSTDSVFFLIVAINTVNDNKRFTYIINFSLEKFFNCKCKIVNSIKGEYRETRRYVVTVESKTFVLLCVIHKILHSFATTIHEPHCSRADVTCNLSQSVDEKCITATGLHSLTFRRQRRRLVATREAGMYR